MRLISDLQYKQLHFPNEQKLKDKIQLLRNGHGLDSWFLFAQAVSEKFPANYHDFNSLIANVADELSPTESANPLAFAIVLKRAGLGPIMSLQTFNAFQFLYGQIPILEGELPTSIDATAQNVLAKNRAAYMKILNQCLNIYSNNKISNREVYEGLCGVLDPSYSMYDGNEHEK